MKLKWIRIIALVIPFILNITYSQDIDELEEVPKFNWTKILNIPPGANKTTGLQILHFNPTNKPYDKDKNLILLTGTQHNTKAHPNNNTRIINKDYQLLCLLAKSDSIEKYYNIYSKEDFFLYYK